MDYQQLHDDFPQLFRREAGGPFAFDQYGFECGPGWLPLIHGLAKQIEAHASQKGLQLKTAQIKSKFNSLRWYIHGSDMQIREWVNEAVIWSAHICEECGREMTPGHDCTNTEPVAQTI